jgi:hypothetical protein
VNGTIWPMTSLKSPLLLAVAATVLLSAPLAAELTVTTTTSIEGGIGGGSGMSPKVVTKISGSKSRTDIDTGDQIVTTIIDSAASQAYILRPDQKSVIQFSTDAPASPGDAQRTIEAEVKPTGKTRDIDGVPCAEYTVMMKMDMAAMAAGGGSALPPEAGAMLKDVFVRISGSTWVAKDAPGAADYVNFQKLAARVAVSAMSRISASTPGSAASPSMPRGLERLITGFPEAAGIPYLTELTSSVEGSGQFVALLQGLAQMKITSKVTSLSTDPIPADTFAIPEGYTVVKQ